MVIYMISGTKKDLEELIEVLKQTITEREQQKKKHQDTANKYHDLAKIYSNDLETNYYKETAKEEAELVNSLNNIINRNYNYLEELVKSLKFHNEK